MSQAAFLSKRPVQYVRTSFSLQTATIIRRPTSVLFHDDQDDDYNNTTAFFDAYTDLYAYRKTVVVMLGRYVGKLNMWALRRVRMRGESDPFIDIRKDAADDVRYKTYI